MTRPDSPVRGRRRRILLGMALFVVALRHLGTARTGAHFSVAPSFGTAVALWLLDESTGTAFWAAAFLMAAGVWLHLTERHDHAHEHAPLTHTHRNVHDEHHQHAHEPGWDGVERTCTITRTTG